MGSQILNMLMVALFNLMNTPLLICLRRKSCKTFFDLGSDLVDTTDTHDKGQFWLSRHMVVSRFPGLTFEPKVITLLITVFFDVLLCTFEDVNTLCSPSQTVLGQLSGTGSPVF